MAPTLLHNPRCSKSRQALQLLEEKQVNFEQRKYLEEPLSQAELVQLLDKLQLTARQLLRSGESIYKELNLQDKSLSEEQLIAAMATHPKLMERPVFIKGDKAIIGRPPEQVLEII
ncbi:arsenate reductase (glutaredoxin) [Marinospirillum sp.]|uniref:arsenate reductase (glutaredoxin) n=1 Tax=Marinospirillum sp. TaxID=2183934 RepID=UPI0028705D4C|nr:arsenate reductase (glutaredoxin) [Marinospirillum sp.]MDR9467818.1 arsenate reductase (glutaredoxin) [Marinospirillum sp.]